MDVHFTRKRHVNPETHEAEITVTLPRGIVGAAGYADVDVDWGIA